MQYALHYSGTRFLSSEKKKILNVLVDSILKPVWHQLNSKNNGPV